MIAPMHSGRPPPKDIAPWPAPCTATFSRSKRPPWPRALQNICKERQLSSKHIQATSYWPAVSHLRGYELPLQARIEMAAEIEWSHKIGEVPAIGLSAERHATPALRAEIAATLDLIACERLDVRYEITPLSQGRYLLEG